jgi:hypothetical protein
MRGEGQHNFTPLSLHLEHYPVASSPHVLYYQCLKVEADKWYKVAMRFKPQLWQAFTN